MRPLRAATLAVAALMFVTVADAQKKPKEPKRPKMQAGRDTNSAGAYRATQSGWYLQGVYQFMPRWRVGLRTEQLDAGSPDFGPNAANFAASDYSPRKNTLMLDFSPSEFSRFRVQFGQDKSRAGVTDNQITLQYQMSLGAHGAHGF